MSDATITPATPPTAVVEAYYRKLEMEADLDDDGEYGDISTQIQERILTATTEDEIFAAQTAGTTAGKEFLNTPFRLREDGVQVMKSTIEPSKDNPKPEPYYALLSVTKFSDGEDVTINCGSKGLVATVIALRDNGILSGYDSQGGMPLMITEKSTRSGNAVLLLSPFKAAIVHSAEKVKAGK